MAWHLKFKTVVLCT